MAGSVKPKKMRVWVGSQDDLPMLFLSQPKHFAGDGWFTDNSFNEIWLSCKVVPKTILRFFTRPRGNTLYEYELTARFIRKIRPEDEK